MAALYLNKVISEVLSMPNINNFSAVEIRTACIANSKNGNLQPSDVRLFVYKELLRLTKKGWLVKKTTKKKCLVHYSKTDLFNSHYTKSIYATTAENPIIGVKVSDSPPTLNVRLSLYNAELMQGLGAVKEYIELKNIYPHLHHELKERYLSAQENNNILKGRIAVLNDLILINNKSEL